jgi:hypothetical protein
MTDNLSLTDKVGQEEFEFLHLSPFHTIDLMGIGCNREIDEISLCEIQSGIQLPSS